MRVLVVLVLLAGPAMAQGLVDQGRDIAENGTEQGAAPCASCHGMDGLSNGNAQFPRLDGQPGYYLAKQLADYAREARRNEVMTPIAQSLTGKQREAVSAYYGSLAVGTPPAPDPSAQVPPGPDPGQLRLGRTLVQQGLAERGVQACTSCHGPDGAGMAPALPRLDGQWSDYAAAQFRAFHDGTRRNDVAGVMRELSRKLTETDILAVTAYLQSLTPGAAPGDAAP